MPKGEGIAAGKIKGKPDVDFLHPGSGYSAHRGKHQDLETRRRPMYWRIGSKLVIAGAVGILGALPASACDGCACGGGAGYGYYGYGQSWGFCSGYDVQSGFTQVSVVVVISC